MPQAPPSNVRKHAIVIGCIITAAIIFALLITTHCRKGSIGVDEMVYVAILFAVFVSLIR